MVFLQENGVMKALLVENDITQNQEACVQMPPS